MTGDLLIRPSIGTAVGVPYVALPPTAVDAEPDGPVRLVAAWHGFDPPRTETAFSAALAMTGVPAWRVYLRLPMPVGWPPPGRDDFEACARAAQQAAEVFPAALDEVRDDLGLEPMPIGLVGMSAGAMAGLLTLAEGTVPVDAAALIAPLLQPGQASDVQPERFDFPARAAEIARNDTAVLLIAGAADGVVTATSLAAFGDLLREKGMHDVTATTFRMSHELALEPGTDAEPPIAEAVSVDAALTEWFRERLGARPRTAGAATAPAPADAPFGDTRDTGDTTSRADLDAGAVSAAADTAPTSRSASLGPVRV